MLIPFLQICNTSQLQQILQNTAYYLLPKLPKVELNSYSVGILLSCIFFFHFLVVIIEVKDNYSGTPRYDYLVITANFFGSEGNAY